MKEIYYNAPCGLYKGFLESEEAREKVLENVLHYAATVEYQRLTRYKDAEERWQKVCDNLNFIGGDRETIIRDGEELQKKHSKEACFSLRCETYWHYSRQYKSDEECELLLAFLALRSILGSKRWGKTTNAMWLSRMDGKNKPEWRIKNGKKELVLSGAIQKYNTHYGARKLKSLLFEYYSVSFYSSHMRGFCFSFLLSIKELVRTIRRKQNEIEKLESKLKSATKDAEDAVNEEDRNSYNSNIIANLNRSQDKDNIQIL